MFSGEYDHTLDPKGRLIIPSKMRAPLGDHFMLVKGFDTCLYAYPMEEWEKIETALMEQPEDTPAERRRRRRFMAGVVECEVDKQGRFVIPPKWREYAHIEKDVVSVGSVRRIEIWSSELYYADLDENEDDMNVFAQNMSRGGVRF